MLERPIKPQLGRWMMERLRVDERMLRIDRAWLGVNCALALSVLEWS